MIEAERRVQLQAKSIISEHRSADVCMRSHAKIFIIETRAQNMYRILRLKRGKEEE